MNQNFCVGFSQVIVWFVPITHAKYSFLLADKDNFRWRFFSYHFFSLLKKSFLPDILTDAKSINPAPIMDIHSAFLWFQYPHGPLYGPLYCAYIVRSISVSELVQPFPLSSVSEIWKIYVKITIELFKIPTLPAFSRWSPSWSKTIAARPLRPNQRT